jgi:hypothetical protein
MSFTLRAMSYLLSFNRSTAYLAREIFLAKDGCDRFAESRLVILLEGAKMATNEILLKSRENRLDG